MLQSGGSDPSQASQMLSQYSSQRLIDGYGKDGIKSLEKEVLEAFNTSQFERRFARKDGGIKPPDYLMKKKRAFREETAPKQKPNGKINTLADFTKEIENTEQYAARASSGGTTFDYLNSYKLDKGKNAPTAHLAAEKSNSAMPMLTLSKDRTTGKTLADLSTTEVQTEVKPSPLL